MRVGAWGGAATVLFAVGAQAAPAIATCAAKQSITVDPRTGWRCEVALSPEQAYLIRVDQRDVDVTVAALDPKNQQLFAIDAPTKRSSPELALLGPQLTGKHMVVIRPADRDAVAARAVVSFAPMRAADGVALVHGLKELTLSAALAEKPTDADAERSITLLRTALKSLHSAEAKEYEAEALLRIASLFYWQIYDWSKAAAAGSDAMVAFERLGNPVMRSQAAIVRAASLIEIASAMKSPRRRSGAPVAQSEFDEAVGLLSRAAVDFEKAGIVHGQAQALNFLGLCLYYQGEYDSAKAKYLQSAQLFDALGDTTSEALPLQNIALIDYENGDYLRAIKSYRSLVGILNPSSDASQYATVLINLGTTQYGLGDFDAALRSFVSALDICEERGFTAEQARSLHSLGMVYLVIGERERAEMFLERALALRRPLASQSPRDLQTSLIRVGDLKRAEGDVPAALKLHLEALDLALSPSQKVRALYAIGRDHEANEALPAAMQAYESALQSGLSEDLPVEALVMGAYGRVRMSSGDRTGRPLILKTARLHEKHGDFDFAAQDYLALALIDRNAAAFDSSLQNVHKAIALYESQRLRAINPDLRATYLASRANAFELQGDLYMTLWERARDPGQKNHLSDLALLANESNRRRLLEDFHALALGVASPDSAETAALDARLAAKRHRLAVIMDQQNPSVEKIEALRRDVGLLRTQLDLAQTIPARATVGASLYGSSPQSSQEIQATLAPDEILLSYQLGEERSWIWSITRETVLVAQLRGRAEVEAAAREFYTMWSTPGGMETDAARELAASRIILGKAAESLRGKRTLTIVAEGLLRTLPFAALSIEDPRRNVAVRIADSHAVRFRSTLSGDAASARKDASRAASGNRILLVGDPLVPSAATRTKPEFSNDPWAWQPLPGTRHEVREIAEIAASWRSYVLLGAEATKPALLSMPLDSFRAIHFATHARLDIQDPQLSAIALSSREASFLASSATLTVREILGFKLQAETVVLSACEASLGKNYRGQLSFGLSEAFLLAGARNVLGSLWRVSDDATQEYMKHFYGQYIRHDASPEAAAQTATRALSRQPEFRNPYYWAAFVVTQK